MSNFIKSKIYIYFKFFLCVFTSLIISGCIGSSDNSSTSKLAGLFKPQTSASISPIGEVFTDSPEAAEWQKESNAVVLVNDLYTASFISNTRNDNRLYLITARHANEEIWWRNQQDYDNNNFIHTPLNVGDTCFRKLTLNFERNGRPSVDLFVNVTARAIGAFSGGNDFVLFEINNPETISPDILDRIYMMGWNKNLPELNSYSNVIHHGIIGDGFKKFSLFQFETISNKNNPPTADGYEFWALFRQTISGGTGLSGGASNSLFVSSTLPHLAVGFHRGRYPDKKIMGTTFNSIYNSTGVSQYLNPDNLNVNYSMGRLYNPVNPLPTDPISRVKLQNENYCLDVDSASTNPNAKIYSWSCHGESHQDWKIKDIKQVNGANYFQLCNKNSSRCLELGSDNTNVIQGNLPANCTSDNCYWRVDFSNKLIYNLSDSKTNSSQHKCLTANRYNLVTYATCSSTNTLQQWTSPTSSTYFIKAQNGRCLEVYQGSGDSGARIALWGCSNTYETNQQWKSFYPTLATDEFDQYSQLCSVRSNFCISIADNGNIVQASNPSATLSAKSANYWGVDSFSRIRNARTNKCITQSANNDTEVTQEYCTTTNLRQRWTFTNAIH